MNKEERIKRYGEAAYDKMLQQHRDWAAAHREEMNASSKAWCDKHREEAKAKTKKWREVNRGKAKAYSAQYRKEHREELKVKSKEWRKNNIEKVKVYGQELGRKGGKRYEKFLEYQRTGLQGERNYIRHKHAKLYYEIRKATPNSVLHHEWIPGTAEYRGAALVNKELHQRGVIKVIKLLEGKITLFTEKEIKKEEKKNE